MRHSLSWLLRSVYAVPARLYAFLVALRRPRVTVIPVPIRHCVSAQNSIGVPVTMDTSNHAPPVVEKSKSTSFLPPPPATTGTPLIPRTIWRRISKGPITIGVCAMAKKAKSAAMLETLNRLTAFLADGNPEFVIVPFPEKMLLNDPVESWPECEALIAFSAGFPLKKAQAYAALRKPFVFNDLVMQELLFDRRAIYRKLEEIDVPVPHYLVLNGGQGTVGV